MPDNEKNLPLPDDQPPGHDEPLEPDHDDLDVYGNDTP